MQITITGARGCGKTTVAIEVAKFLRERGCEVRLKGDGKQHNDFLRDALKGPPNRDAMTLPMPVTILDSFDPIDEYTIQQVVKCCSE